MLDNKALSKLLGQLYDAAAKPTLWTPFLREITEATAADTAALLIHNSNDHLHNVVTQFGFDPRDLEEFYNRRGDIEDVWATKVRARPSGWVGALEPLYPMKDLKKSDFYRECLCRFDLLHGVVGVMHNSGPVMANVGIYRSARHGAFDAEQQQLIELLLPHLTRAFQLHSYFQGQNQLIDSVIDMLPCGVIFLDEHGKIICMNRSASTLITKRDGLLTTKYGELRALQSHDSQALQALIRQSIATSKGRGFGAGGIVSIARATRPQLQVLVTPVRSTSVALIPQVPAAAVFIVDPTHRAHPRVETLRKTFSLTTAEARLALLLSKGRSLTQIAEALGVSRNTLHTQLGSVFRKTGTSRQGELISLLMQFPDTKAAETTDDGSSEASHESNGTT